MVGTHRRICFGSGLGASVPNVRLGQVQGSKLLFQYAWDGAAPIS